MSILTLVTLITAGPAAAGLIIAAVLALTQRRRSVAAARSSRVTLSIAAFIAIVISVGVSFWLAFPSATFSLNSLEAYRSVFPVRFALPIVLGLILVALGLVGVPRVQPRSDGQTPPADATRIGAAAPTVRPWWVVALSILTAIVVIVTVFLGVHSEPDASGRYVLHTQRLGSATSSSTIYGWHYSIPIIVAIAAMLALTWLLLRRITRRGAGRAHARAVVAATAGALLLHLGMVLDDLGSLVLSLHVEFSEDQGAMMAGNPESPLATTIGIASTLALILGYLVWWQIVLSAASAKPGPRGTQAQTGRSNRAPDS